MSSINIKTSDKRIRIRKVENKNTFRCVDYDNIKCRGSECPWYFPHKHDNNLPSHFFCNDIDKETICDFVKIFNENNCFGLTLTGE